MRVPEGPMPYDIHDIDDLLAHLHDDARRQEAFGRFYDTFARRVYAYVLRMTADACDADDILQETFLRCYRYLVGGGRLHDPLGYLLLVARHRVYNAHRDRRPTADLTDDVLVDEGDDEAESSRLDDIAWAVSRLPAALREPFVLRYYDDLSYDRMATLTGDSAGALRNRVWRAKEAIRRMLRLTPREATR